MNPGNQTSDAGGDKQGQGNNVTSKNECTFVFLGDKQSGKTSLIAKLLDEPLKDDVKETTALDFRYGSRVKDDKKQKINIYELGKYHTQTHSDYRWRSNTLTTSSSADQCFQSFKRHNRCLHCCRPCKSRRFGRYSSLLACNSQRACQQSRLRDFI